LFVSNGAMGGVPPDHEPIEGQAVILDDTDTLERVVFASGSRPCLGWCLAVITAKPIFGVMAKAYGVNRCPCACLGAVLAIDSLRHRTALLLFQDTRWRDFTIDVSQGWFSTTPCSHSPRAVEIR
jgi:hypothetical protein